MEELGKSKDEIVKTDLLKFKMVFWIRLKWYLSIIYTKFWEENLYRFINLGS